MSWWSRVLGFTEEPVPFEIQKNCFIPGSPESITPLWTP